MITIFGIAILKLMLMFPYTYKFVYCICYCWRILLRCAWIDMGINRQINNGEAKSRCQFGHLLFVTDGNVIT